MKSNRTVALVALASLSTALAFPGASKAVIITVGGQQYDVTTFTGTYNSNTSLFNTPANVGGVMPWWGNSTLAQQFAIALGDALGYPNNSGNYGPRFAYNFTSTVLTWVKTSTQTNPINASIVPDAPSTYAQVSVVSPPATGTPGPLPILGAASAFGMSRRLRRRIASQAFKL